MAIVAQRKVRGLLEGEYLSIFKGRSMDFDDLRAYEPGDEVKDIDWKATARSAHPLVRRYAATRKHNILLLVDTGRSMAAVTPTGESKRDVAVLASGMLGYIAQKHGDLVGLAAGSADDVCLLPTRGNNAHLEHVLQTIHRAIAIDGPKTDLLNVLRYAATHVRRRMMLVIVASTTAIDLVHERLLRRLRAQHEIMTIWIDDLAPGDPERVSLALHDVDDAGLLPAFIRRNKKLHTEYFHARSVQEMNTAATFDSLGIAHVRMSGEQTVIPQLFRLLENKKHGKR